jgi:hypothetical protein
MAAAASKTTKQPPSVFKEYYAVLYFDDSNTCKRKKLHPKDTLAINIAIAYATLDDCNVNLSPGHFADALSTSKIMMLAKRVGTSEVLGFILADPSEEGVYVDIICAEKGMGAPLLNQLEHMALLRGMSVTLNAMDYAVGFYERMGYSHRSSCSDDAVMYPNYVTADRKINCESTVTPSLCKRTGRYSECYNKQCTGKDCTSLRYDEYIAYMLELNERGLMKRSNNACNPKNLRTLASMDEKMEAFKTHNCASNGFVMKKCATATAVKNAKASEARIAVAEAYAAVLADRRRKK